MKSIDIISEHLLNAGFNIGVDTRGYSMFPVVLTGDRVIIGRDKDPVIGDIILFRRQDELVCHRLVKIFEENGIEYFQTRGDSSLCLDEPIMSNQIIGRVMRIDRQKISLARWALLSLQPLLRKGRLNAVVVSALVRTKELIYLYKPHA